jgi:4-hydroxy-3-polyprenylbenzoate decarboxylase
LLAELPTGFSLPEGFSNPKFVQPGILAVQSPGFEQAAGYADTQRFTKEMERLGGYFEKHVPLILLVDDAAFTAATLNNFLWVAFTRVNPSHDLHGILAFSENKHWGCRGGLVLDARKKPHHAPELVPDPQVSERVDRLMKELGL